MKCNQKFRKRTYGARLLSTGKAWKCIILSSGSLTTNMPSNQFLSCAVRALWEQRILFTGGKSVLTWETGLCRFGGSAQNPSSKGQLEVNCWSLETYTV